MSRAGRSVLDYLTDVSRLLASYIRGQLLVSFCMMLLYAAGFGLLDVPLWPLLAVVCGFLHVAPMIGAVLGLLIPVSAAMIAGASSYQILGIIAVFGLAQGIESFYLTPRILGSHLRVRPFLVFLALLIGGSLFGVLGALVAVPAVAIAMFTWRFLNRSKDRKGAN